MPSLAVTSSLIKKLADYFADVSAIFVSLEHFIVFYKKSVKI
jgi:hypothetical protein